jgi:hypothetical protein
MARRKSESTQPVSIKVGNISAAGGEVNIAGGDISVQKGAGGLSAGEIQQLFNTIHAAIDARPATPPADKADLKAEVQELQTAVSQAAAKQQPVDEGFLARRFRSIARIAPDILDVAVSTLANPLAGLGVAAHKIAEKAKEK